MPKKEKRSTFIQTRVFTHVGTDGLTREINNGLLTFDHDEVVKDIKIMEMTGFYMILIIYATTKASI